MRPASARRGAPLRHGGVHQFRRVLLAAVYSSFALKGSAARTRCVSAARSSTGGRLPRGFGLGAGNNGWMRSQSASCTSGLPWAGSSINPSDLGQVLLGALMSLRGFAPKMRMPLKI